jgi:hypothetical protein
MHLEFILILDNGKLMRIAHFFTDDYFLNDELDEERIQILEEIQVFEKNTSINQLTMLKYYLFSYFTVSFFFLLIFLQFSL